MSTPFPPIADYAFLSDCEVNALVAPDGNVEWLCLPRPDAASVFGAVLDRSAGGFQLAPAGVATPTARRYLPGTMVLETTWHTPTGWAVVRDLLVVAHRGCEARDQDFRRSPGDFRAQRALLRHVTCIEGQVTFQLFCLPLFDYGSTAGTWSYQGDGYGFATMAGYGGSPSLRLTSSFRLGLSGPRAYARADLEQGQSGFAALSWGELTPESEESAAEALRSTVAYWRGWLGSARLPDHRWRPYLERSVLTLKGLSYAPTGAILAAATTSLPETPGGVRNWDYRYTWIRDSAFMLRALFQLGFEWEAFEYFVFLIETQVGGGARQGLPLQIMYGIGGERELSERTLDHLSGYAGSRPVRIGNGAYDQRQHDVWGMVLDSILTHLRNQAAQINRDIWAGVTRLVERALESYPEPDRGIWEVRGEPQHFTSSKVMCWVAVDRGTQLARARGDEGQAARWQAAADEMREEICRQAVDGRGVFVQRYGGTTLDAALLLIPLMGFLPPDDERVRATVLAIADELTEGGLVLRYRTEHTDDGLAGDEGTFTICSFWLVSALAMIGETQRARRLCEKLLSLAGPLLLYAEEIDAASGQHLGNFPQAFTHLALIDAVLRLIEEEASDGPSPWGSGPARSEPHVRASIQRRKR